MLFKVLSGRRREKVVLLVNQVYRLCVCMYVCVWVCVCVCVRARLCAN